MKRDDIRKAWECCLDHVRARQFAVACGYCPYIKTENCIEQMIKDTVKLMEQEDIEIEGGGTTWWHVCPECHGAVDKGDHFCRHCGQAIK